MLHQGGRGQGQAGLEAVLFRLNRYPLNQESLFLKDPHLIENIHQKVVTWNISLAKGTSSALSTSSTLIFLLLLLFSTR